MRKKLTSRFVETVALPTRRRAEYHDELLPGLRFRVFSTGRKSWSVVGRVKGKQVRHTIGTYPTILLTEARETGRLLLRNMQLERYTEPEIPLPYARWVTRCRNSSPNMLSPRTGIGGPHRACCRGSSRYFTCPLAEVKRSDVVRILDRIIAEGKPYRANRVLAAIKKLFAWALDRGLIDVHPIFGLKPPSKEIARDRILTEAETRAFWIAADAMGFPFGPALLLLLLNGPTAW